MDNSININDLFDEILEIIFKALPRRSRLTCKEVCQRWCQILMESPLFKMDRHIYLERCAISEDKPPMSIFMKTKHSYQIITLRGHFLPVSGALTKMNRNMGLSLKEVHFVQVTCSVVHIVLLEMPLIESLNIEFKHYFQNWCQGSFLPERHLLKNLKELKVKTRALDVYLLRDLIFPLRELIPDHVIPEIVIQECSFEPFNQELSAMVLSGKIKLKIHSMVASLHRSRLLRAQFKHFLACNLELERFIVSFPEDIEECIGMTFECLLNKMKNVNDVCVITRFLPLSLSESAHKITGITIQPNDSIESLKYLENLVNLRKLHIRIYKSVCPFGHETVNFKKLEEFFINREFSCEQCMDAIKKSFENSKSIKIRVPGLVFEAHQKEQPT